VLDDVAAIDVQLGAPVLANRSRRDPKRVRSLDALGRKLKRRRRDTREMNRRDPKQAAITYLRGKGGVPAAKTSALRPEGKVDLSHHAAQVEGRGHLAAFREHRR
jgi:hypothetical protein